jgi:hypothetical protein
LVDCGTDIFINSVSEINVSRAVRLRKYGIRNKVLNYVRSEVVTVVNMKRSVFRDINPRGKVILNPHFGGKYHLHLQGRRVNH